MAPNVTHLHGRGPLTRGQYIRAVAEIAVAGGLAPADAPDVAAAICVLHAARDRTPASAGLARHLEASVTVLRGAR